MKGTVYSGIAYMPEHPDADIHGLIRVVIQCSNFPSVMGELENAGIPNRGLWTSNIWQVSKSHAEQAAAERHYGELLACPLMKQYLKPEYYQPIPAELLKQNKLRKNGHENIKPRSGITPAKF